MIVDTLELHVAAQDPDEEDVIFRLFNGRGTLTIDGNDYFGTGAIVSFSNITITAEYTHSEMQLTLSGASPDLVSQAINDDYQNHQVIIKTHIIEDDMTITHTTTRFKGVVSHPTITDSRQGDDGIILSDIVFMLTTDLVADQVSQIDIYSDASQRRRDPRDSIFENLADATNDPLIWGP